MCFILKSLCFNKYVRFIHLNMNVYSSQILSNVEHLSIACQANDYDFIGFAPKLRQLDLYISCLKPEQVAKIHSMFKHILNERNNGHAKGDFIKVMFNYKKIFEIFTEINDNSGSIKLSFVNMRLCELYPRNIFIPLQN